MKKNLAAISAVVIFLTAVVNVYAANDHANENGKEHASINSQDNKPENSGKSEEHKNTPIQAPVNDPDDDCEDDVKNHGDFVSCIAHRHEGGGKVSDAARSDTGKKDHSEEEDEAEPSPTVTPTVTPTEIITPTVTPTVAPDNESSEALDQTGLVVVEQIQALIDELKQLISSLTSAFNN